MKLSVNFKGAAVGWQEHRNEPLTRNWDVKLEQARRLALEPTDPLTRERLTQMIEDLEFQLRDQRKVA